MISSIWGRYKPAWPSHRINRPPIPKREPAEPSLIFLICLFRQRVHAHGLSLPRIRLPRGIAPVGTTRGEMVYELCYTALPPDAFTPADVVALYLHRGAFEPVLADEDKELDRDRWCSHTAWGQEFWLIVAQWTWNLRLELGHVLHPTPMRTTECALARSPEPTAKPGGAPQGPISYQPKVGAVSRMGCIAGEHFTLQPDGTVQCPAGFPLYPPSAPS